MMGSEDREDHAMVSSGVFLGPVRRSLKPDDEFFDAGNVQRALLCKMSVYRSTTQGRSDGDNMQINDGLEQRSYECMFKGCPCTFSSLARYEAHYGTSHRNRCAECGRSFPTNRLLDLHLSETHDSFFKAMAERRAMYRCLVEDCQEVFQTGGKRAVHLVEVHRYPTSFDFSRPSYTTKERVRNRKTKSSKREDCTGDDNEAACRTDTKQNPGLFRQNSDDNPTAGIRKGCVLSGNREDGNTGMDVVHEASAENDSARSIFGSGTKRANSKHNGQQKQLQLRRSRVRVCKFWRTAEGCRAGSECRFRHANPLTKTDADDIDTLGSSKVFSGGLCESQVVPAAVAVRSEFLVEQSLRRVAQMDACLILEKASNRDRRKGSIEMDVVVGDVAMDGLVEGMKKLNVPSTLSFGRSARRGKTRGVSGYR